MRALMIVLALSLPAAASETQVWSLIGRKELGKGTLQGTSFDGDGRLRLGASLTRMAAPEATGAIWCAARLDGVLYLGAGNDGWIYKRRGEALVKHAHVKGLIVTALVARGDHLLAATLPAGRIVRVGKDGAVETFSRLPDPYPWAMVARGDALFVASGPSGVVYRVDAKGAASPLFDAGEGNLLTVVEDGRDLLVGGDDGTVWRVRTGDVGEGRRARAVAQLPGEVRALARKADGRVLAAVNAAPKLKEVAYVKAIARAVEGERAGTRTLDRTSLLEGTFTSAAYRIGPRGQVALLCKLDEQLTLAAAATASGWLLASGVDGRVRALDDRGRLAATFATGDGQATCLVVEDGKLAAIGAGPDGALHAVGAPASGRYLTPVLDAKWATRWGAGRISARGELTVESRSGWVAEPDEARWSAWAAVERDGADFRTRSPRGRYLQLRVTWKGADGVLERLEVRYRQDNQRPEIAGLFAKAAVEDEDDDDELRTRLERGAPTTKVEIKWKVGDPDGDRLRYVLEYRLVGGEQWAALRLAEPLKAKATRAVWDTALVPDGVYRVRLRVSDDPSNPAAEALSAEASTRAIRVDHTRPTLGTLVQSGRRLAGTATDLGSPVAAVRYSIGGGRWLMARPRDGIYDSRTEGFEIPLTGLKPGRHTLSIRAVDAEGNAALTRTTITID